MAGHFWFPRTSISCCHLHTLHGGNYLLDAIKREVRAPVEPFCSTGSDWFAVGVVGAVRRGGGRGLFGVLSYTLLWGLPSIGAFDSVRLIF